MKKYPKRRKLKEREIKNTTRFIFPTIPNKRRFSTLLMLMLSLTHSWVYTNKMQVDIFGLCFSVKRVESFTLLSCNCNSIKFGIGFVFPNFC